MNDLSYSIVGAGAVGALYGALLRRSGRNVDFLFHSDYEHVKTAGLRVESPWGDFHLPAVNAHVDPRKTPRNDVVIVALKTTENAALIEILPHLVRPGGIVLTLQNGLGNERTIAEIVGPEHVLGGLCFLCSNKVGPGHVRHLDYGLITLGEYRENGADGGVTDRLRLIAAHFVEAGVPIQTVENLDAARWRKLVWNIPFNGLSVTRDQLTDALMRDPETRALSETLMREVAEASTAHGHSIEEAFIEKMLNDTAKMAPYAPSMKLDHERGNALELGAIYEEPLLAARRLGVEMPKTRELLEQLRALNPVG